MRINQPVINQEFPFPSGQTLVSTTDLKGRILYGNPAFFAVSGYGREELLGQPHNVIRHPDMPQEAFRDMWQTIGQGLPWSAPVKNRRKDGSFYWVMANVTPLIENGAPVGYMSERSEPSREEVQAAEALYATMRAETAAGHLVHRFANGQLHVVTLPGRLRRMLHLDIQLRLGLLMGALGGACALAAAWAAGGAPGGSVLAVAALCALAAAALGTWATQAIAVQPMQALVGIANRMAAGDLTQRIEAHGDDLPGRMRRALSQLNVNLRSIVRDARTQVDSMRDAMREIASGNQDLSSRTESQAASLEQTASSMEQITSTVRNSASSADAAAKLAARASSVTQHGSEAMHAVTQTMQTITEASQRIAEIIGVIDSIAFQTNILALNAAVEAARAGEQGRGFAVVASEVRALSQRTAQAAREVRDLIGESSQKVEAGNRLTEAAQKTMDGALATVREVTQVVGGISHAADEQLTGISQVNAAVAQIETITQQNAALVEQIAAAAAQLQAQAANVSEAVQVFRLDAIRSTRPDAVALRRAARPQAQAGAADTKTAAPSSHR